MPDMSQSSWLWIVVAVGILIVVGLGWFVGYKIAFRRIVRRYLVGMIARRENLEASRRALETVIAHLADADDEKLMEFAGDAASEDRRTFHEVAQRMGLLRDELDHMRLPARVVPVAEQMADSAYLIALEAGKIHDDMTADEVLEAVGSIDLSAIWTHLDETRRVLEATCGEYDIQETAVYGGGLYI
ncbi:MAG: hypothetical protein CVT60_01100 [Actinobacteria bacterium HGW-Actinobacteria-10]|nr:MAG: hypothetical protein CVT60_01100 [Actinobacteria bacterium HGW-Actinobacteria-10]